MTKVKEGSTYSQAKRPSDGVSAIRPSSPLPWEFEAFKPDWAGDATYVVRAVTDSCLISNSQYYNSAPAYNQDAEYIVQACNNYLKMVEMLREVDTYCDARKDAAMFVLHAKVTGLLREIGEL